MRTIFNDIDFNDTESVMGNQYDSETKTQICDYYVKLYTSFYSKYIASTLIYNFVDDTHVCFSEKTRIKSPQANKNNETYDNIFLPYRNKDIIVMLKFNTPYNIEYIRGRILNYNVSNHSKRADVELFLLRYANDIMTNNNCTVDEIIFTDEDDSIYNTLNEFTITMCYERRESIADTPPLTEEFCKQFPKLSFGKSGVQLTNKLIFDRCHFESEKAFIYACNRLHKLYPNMVIDINAATVYFGGHALWDNTSYFNKYFLNTVLEFESYDNVDEHIIIEINKLNKCLKYMNESLYKSLINNIAKVVKKSINEARSFGDFDRKGTDPLVKNIAKLIGSPSVKYAVTIINPSVKQTSGTLMSFICKATDIHGINTPCGFYVKRTFNENGIISINPNDFSPKKLNIPYKDKTINYLIFVVVNKGYGENSYRGYIFDKDLILDIIQNLKKLKKQNKDKHSIKDEFNNRYDDKKVYLSPKFLETAIYRIDDTYYVKTREELNGKYDF